MWDQSQMSRSGDFFSVSTLRQPWSPWKTSLAFQYQILYGICAKDKKCILFFYRSGQKIRLKQVDMKPSSLVSPEPLSNAKSEFLFNHAIQTLKLNLSPVKFFTILSIKTSFLARTQNIFQENCQFVRKMCCGHVARECVAVTFYSILAPSYFKN